MLECLEPAHIKNDEAMKCLFSLFCIVNIEHRSGNITIDDIECISEDYLQFQIMIQQLGGNIQNKDKSIIRKQEFYKKYNDID